MEPIQIENPQINSEIETVNRNDDETLLKALQVDEIKSLDYESKDFEQELITQDNVTGEFEGYICRYSNIDRHEEIIMPGAFKESIQKAIQTETRQDIKLLWQHDHHKPIGQIFSFRETAEGVIAKGKLDPSIIGIPLESIVRFIKQGIIKHFSVGFKVTKEKKNEKGNRIIMEGDLIEFSLVTIPANLGAGIISIKSIEVDKSIKEIVFKEEKTLTQKIKEATGLSELTSILKNDCGFTCSAIDALTEFNSKGYHMLLSKFLEKETLKTFFDSKDLYILRKEFEDITKKSLDKQIEVQQSPLIEAKGIDKDALTIADQGIEQTEETPIIEEKTQSPARSAMIKALKAKIAQNPELIHMLQNIKS